jgi:zinc protease
MSLVRKYYADWPAGYVPPRITPEPVQSEEKHVEVTYDGRSLPILALAYKFDAFDPSNRLRVAADLLSEMAFGSTSELYKKLVIDEQLVEFLQADPGVNRDPGLLDLYTRVKDPERIDDVLASIDAAIDTFRDTLVADDDLAALKSRLRYGFLMGMETPDAVARGLSRLIAVSGGIEAVDELYRAYETVTAEDVRDAARRYLDTERRTVGILRAAP